MLATGKSLRTLFLVLTICFIASTPAYSQSSMFFNASNSPGNRTSSRAWLAKCQTISTNAFARGRYTEETEWPAIAHGIAVDRNPPVALDAVCLEAARSAPRRASADNPCRQEVLGVSGTPDVPSAGLCNESTDTIPAELSGFGKSGAKIARAREEVLEILRNGNACTDWFAIKDANPAATFQSLNFLLDRRGPQDIFESNEATSIILFRQPYVASATQDGGARTAITINAHGAFYRPQGNVLKTVPEGGPLRADGTQVLTVGSYRGDTLPAQIVTLLHEFGHIIDLLPEDADNLDGRSVRNTNEVLLHCRAEVEAHSQLARQTAKR